MYFHVLEQVRNDFQEIIMIFIMFTIDGDNNRTKQNDLPEPKHF